MLRYRYNGINLALTNVYRASSNLSPSNQEKIADVMLAQRTWKRILYFCDSDLQLILGKEWIDKIQIGNRTKEGQYLQEYYDAQKFWIAGNRAKAFFGLVVLNLIKNIFKPPIIFLIILGSGRASQIN